MYPRTVEDVQRIVQHAAACKAVNAVPHSPNDLWCCKDDEKSILICMRNLGAVLEVDVGNALVKVQGGATLEAVMVACEQHGLTMAALPTLKTMSVAGAISTGCHGTGWELGCLSTRVQWLKMVLGDGTVVECSSLENPTLFRAALCSLGALGIIVELILKVDRAYVISEQYEWSTVATKTLDIRSLGQ
jgi:D-arabinono-1,4-lactone oxidase